MPPSNPFWRAMIRRRVRRQYNVLTERGHAAPHYSRRQEPAGPLRIFGTDVCRDIGHQGHARSARRSTRPYPPGRRPGPAEATGDLRRPSAARLRHRPALVSSRSRTPTSSSRGSAPQGASGFMGEQPRAQEGLVQGALARGGAVGGRADLLSAGRGAPRGGPPFAPFVSAAPGGSGAGASRGAATRQYRELALRDYG